MALEDLTPSNRFELALSGDMTAEEASNRLEKILAGADIEPSNRLEYFLKLRVSEGGGGGEFDIFDQTAPSGVVTSDATVLTDFILASRTGITELVIPECTTIEQQACFNCTNLVKVYAPKASLPNFSPRQFSGCRSLEKAVLPGQSGPVYGWTYENCTALSVADLGPGTASIGANTFNACSNLKTVIIRSATVCGLNPTAFTGTPFASGGTGGTLYVPQALISQYQAAAAWSTILGYANNQIQAIEGSVYENAYADGTPIS